MSAFPIVTLRDFDMEIEGLKRETLRAQEEHEGLVAVRDRLESDRGFVEEQLAKTKVNGIGMTSSTCTKADSVSGFDT